MGETDLHCGLVLLLRIKQGLCSYCLPPLLSGYVSPSRSLTVSLSLSLSESEVCKLETLLQSEVSVVTSGDVVGADSAKTTPALRRRKRTCSRRLGDREREGGGAGGGERGDRGIGEERREAGESTGPWWCQEMSVTFLLFDA